MPELTPDDFKPGAGIVTDNPRKVNVIDANGERAYHVRRVMDWLLDESVDEKSPAKMIDHFDTLKNLHRMRRRIEGGVE